MPPDVLLTRLERFTTDGAFTGRYAGPRRNDIEKSFERVLAQIYERAGEPECCASW